MRQVASRPVGAFTVHEVLAGAYRGRDIGQRAMLSHASADGGDTALCGGVLPGSLCDVTMSTTPTCKRCLARVTSR